MSEATVSQTGYMMKINLQPDKKTIHITAQTRIIRILHELYENQALWIHPAGKQRWVNVESIFIERIAINTNFLLWGFYLYQHPECLLIRLFCLKENKNTILY